MNIPSIDNIPQKLPKPTKLFCGNFMGPSREDLWQMKLEQAAKRKRRARYMQIIEEDSFKRAGREDELYLVRRKWKRETDRA